MNSPTIHTTKTTYRKLILYIIDALVILVIGSIVALGFAILHDLHNQFLSIASLVCLSVAIHSLTAAVFKLNNIIWRYAESKEYLYLFLIQSLGAAISFTVCILLYPLSVTLLVSFEVCSVLVILITRLCYQAYCNYQKQVSSPDGKRLLIIGAGAAACRLLDEIHSTQGCSKAFSSCGSHLTAVTLYYGSVLLINTKPSMSYALREIKWCPCSTQW